MKEPELDSALIVEVIKPGGDGYGDKCREHDCPGCAILWHYKKDMGRELIVQYKSGEDYAVVPDDIRDRLRGYLEHGDDYEMIVMLKEALFSDKQEGTDCGRN